jgi:hypothetical protein
MSNSFKVETSGGSFVVVNNIGLVVTVLLGAWATVFSDLFPDSTLASFKLWLGVGWILCLLAALYIYGYQDGVLGSEDSNTKMSPLRFFSRAKKRVMWGVANLQRNAGYTFMAIVMSLAAAWCVYGKYASTKDDPYSLVRSLVERADRLERIAQETQQIASVAAMAAQSADAKTEVILEKAITIEANLTRPRTPREQLASQGLSWDAKGFIDALNTNDPELVDLYIKGGFNVMSPAPEGYEGNILGAYASIVTPLDPVRGGRIIDILHNQINLTEEVAQFRGLPSMSFSAVAVLTCNLYILESLTHSAVDYRNLGSPYMISQFSGGKIPINASDTITTNKRNTGVDSRPCTSEMKAKMRKILQIE